ncbi:TPM domain-containing protein [Kaistella sp. G5-32]|uniref:TPM domain-containing protein n=1 Tax=Kaistella gelatinilytica TaxID=2787636 RepID=A0ABS0FEX6_9FLAO|nr:TPM domain-containing protein [Kaistella gelatinilytica]MBF8458236.1 TPM domain-containing protein [Kaistella gelatinilytica]
MMNDFLTDQQMASLVEAIQTAEDYSSGEIRIHIDSNTEGNNAEIAFEVFKRLCKDKTIAKNAVLFHVNFEQKYLTIIGDEGIHEKVDQNFWERMHDRITAEFSKGNFHDGLKNAVLETGLELKKYFPITGENPNELPNEITFS